MPVKFPRAQRSICTQPFVLNTGYWLFLSHLCRLQYPSMRWSFFHVGSGRMPLCKLTRTYSYYKCHIGNAERVLEKKNSNAFHMWRPLLKPLHFRERWALLIISDLEMVDIRVVLTCPQVFRVTLYWQVERIRNYAGLVYTVRGLLYSSGITFSNFIVRLCDANLRLFTFFQLSLDL